MALTLVIASTTLSQDQRRPQQQRQAQTHQVFTLRGVEFTEEQQAEVEDLRKKYMPKLMDIQRKHGGIFTDDQRQTFAAGLPDVVTVIPEGTDEILANPGMGWETFHKTANDDNNLPAWIPSTIHYARWGWKTLEPEKGKTDYEFLDSVLEETRESGQQLAFRVMCCSPYPLSTITIVR